MLEHFIAVSAAVLTAPALVPVKIVREFLSK
jgi:hypothetical protein